jgi:hypothetical protein
VGQSRGDCVRVSDRIESLPFTVEERELDRISTFVYLP